MTHSLVIDSKLLQICSIMKQIGLQQMGYNEGHSANICWFTSWLEKFWKAGTNIAYGLSRINGSGVLVPLYRDTGNWSLVVNRKSKKTCHPDAPLRRRESQRGSAAWRVALSAMAIAMSAPTVSLADDTGLPLIALAGLDFTEIALDDAALAQIRGEGLDPVVPTGLGEDRTAVILWDEERPGGSQQSVQVGSFNGDSAGSAISAAGN